MLFSAEVEKFIWEGIIFLTFILLRRIGRITLCQKNHSPNLLQYIGGHYPAPGRVIAFRTRPDTSTDHAAFDRLSAGDNLPAYYLTRRLFPNYGHLDSRRL